MIKAIETRYKGYRFRSRLEARWAIYLDSLGHYMGSTRWRYEAEGFELPSGRYLPDFELMLYGGWGRYLEIKGGQPTEHECALAAELSAMDGVVAVAIVSGDVPGEDGWRVWVGGAERTPVYPWFGMRRERSELQVKLWCAQEDLRSYDEEADMWQRALNAARSARFEHGESGPA